MIRAAMEVLILLSTVGSWVRMYTKGGHGLLSDRGLVSLKYYTVLSNLFAGAVSAAVLVLMLTGGAEMQLPMWAAMLKYASAVTIFVTFAVVMVFLGPAFGYRPMFAGELLFLHGIGPILAVISFFFFTDLPDPGFAGTFAAVIPTLIYAIGYAGNILKNGIGEGQDTNDWYGFLGERIERLPAVFCIILGGTWVLAWIFWLLRF